MRHSVDYAIIGGGGAGLSMLCHLHWSGALEGKRLVIIEPDQKTEHDRTWSYWEMGEGPFEHLVYHRWNSIGVHNDESSATYQLGPMGYKLIRSIDFYAYCKDLIGGLSDVEWIYAKAEGITVESDSTVTFQAGGKNYHANWAFSSLPHPIDYRKVKQPYLDQHFRGWFVRTEQDAFDPDHATLMDFRTEQSGETRFLYVLPFSKRKAIVEIAIFSNNHLSADQYDLYIKEYLQTHWPQTGKYEIYHTEQGNIPMTTYPFPTQKGHLIYIGLGGGQARPSTGYTFYNMQVRLSALAKEFASKGAAVTKIKAWPDRHLLYDATLLNLLQSEQLAGANLFPDLFAKNPSTRVLQFLSGETSLLQELKLMSTTNLPAFGASFVKQLVNR